MRLFRFLKDTRPDAMENLRPKTHLQTRAQFLARIRDTITRRGMIDVLHRGSKAYPASLKMFAKNVFSVTRQLCFSPNETKLALDLCVFINGLPAITFELKKQLAKQNMDDAVYRYKTGQKAV